jgi:hypothetical protein
VKKIIIIIALFAVTLYFAAGKAKIFFVNLYSEKADVRFGEEKSPVFFMNGANPYTASKIVSTDRTGKFKLYFKTSAESKWYYWIDENKETINSEVLDGDVICILFGYEGTIEIYYLDQPKDTGAYVCLLNGTNTNLSKMAVSKSWTDDAVIYMEDMDPDVISNFLAITPDTYGLFWQFPDQVADDRYFYLPDNKKNVAMYSFLKNKYYIFLAYTKDDKDYAAQFDISP